MFDEYRVFYGQTSDPTAARMFLIERMESGESTVLLADSDGEPIGFTQLYPSYSSVAMKRVWILNDLFVSTVGRRQGVGRQLLQAASEYAKATGAVRLSLATAHNNLAAKALYEQTGWQLDQHFDHYNYVVPMS